MYPPAPVSGSQQHISYQQQPQQPFMPQAAYQGQVQQQYAEMYGGSTPSFPAAYPPQGPHQGGGQPGPGGLPLNSPNLLNFMAAGSLLSGAQTWGQQYVERAQQRMGWLSVAYLNVYFNIDRQYVFQKLLLLFAPYLKKWTYNRQPEQIQGAQKYRPPRYDVNAPDLYIPLTAVWTYIIFVSIHQVVMGKFKPDIMYHTLSSSLMGWTFHAVVAGLLLRIMSLPSSISWVELFALTGYSFVPVCLSIVCGYLGGYWGYYISWAYGSLCCGVFLVRTMKRFIFAELRQYGRDLHMVNYLLLALAVFQFPFALWLGVRPPVSVWHMKLLKPF